jgi:hypothetical protein
MPDLEFTKHVRHILRQRKILEEWVWRVINTPDRKGRGDDDNMHYTKTIREKEGRVLHVGVITYVQPNRIVTVFFDRRLEKQK